jgi:D-proline reductase (dithiol) PrdB
VGRIEEFSLTLRTMLRVYRWRRIDPVPWAPLRKPLNRCRLAIVSSAGFTAPGQDLFHSGRGGDPSFRFLPRDTTLTSLHEGHRSDSFDHSGIRQDPNLAFPLQRAEELVTSGRIGSLNQKHLSMMGSITAPGRLIKRTAPEAARALQADGVDVALMVPV